MTDYWLADTHLGHNNIIKYCNRPFSSTDEMDECIINNINETVKDPDKDRVWHLGDYCFGPRDFKQFYRKAEGYRNRIKCKNIFWIHGNHDPDPDPERDDPHYRDKLALYDDFRELFTNDYSLKQMRISSHKLIMCHYAFAVWNKSHRDSINLYGHSHAGIETWMESIMPGRKSMDVGIDNIAKIFGSYRPVSFAEIMGIMNSKPGFKNHHREQI